MKKFFSVGEVARLLGISPQTIRKYELAGLIKTMRKDNNYRHFETPDITMLMRIRLFRNLGFSLDMIRKLISRNPCELDELYEERLRELEEEMSQLQRKIECVRLHRDYASQSITKQNILSIEPSPEMDFIIYRKGRAIDTNFLKNDDLASLMEYMPPYQYMIRLRQDAYFSGKEEFETGLVLPSQFKGKVPELIEMQHFPSRICVSVIIRHDINHGKEGWNHPRLSDDFRDAGVFSFMDKNSLKLKGDIIGVTYFDTYGEDLFSHYIKYYFPVF